MLRVAKSVLLILTTALSVLFASGCILAVLFELQGFGAPRDQGPRPLYLASLAVAFVACVAAPVAARRFLNARQDGPTDADD